MITKVTVEYDNGDSEVVYNAAVADATAKVATPVEVAADPATTTDTTTVEAPAADAAAETTTPEATA